jgi:hypothetical protein
VTPDALPQIVVLFAVASVARWLRGASWADALRGDPFHAGVGLAAGLVAGVAATLAAGGGRIGTPPQLALVVLATVAAAIAAELALRGWLVERVLARGAGPVLAVLIGAIADGALAPGGFDARLGAAACGAGLGWIYVAGGRSALASTCARVAFALAPLGVAAARGMLGA